jgi:hypothetical protein
MSAWKFTGTIIVLLAATASFGAEFEVHPSLAVSEEYTDNVYDSPSRVSDYITRTMPGIVMAMKSPVFTGDLSYQFDYRYYARNSRSDDQTHFAACKGHLTMAENLLFLDLNDDYRRVSLDVSRDVTGESLYFNQSDRNIASASPYLVFHPGSSTLLKTGYRFIDTRYFDSVGVDKMAHVAFGEVGHELSPKWQATLGYTFTHEESNVNDYDQHQGYAGLRFEYADKSFILGQGGGTWTSFANGISNRKPYWNAGITHSFGSVTAILTSTTRYDEDPLGNVARQTLSSFTLEKALARGTTGVLLSYSEFASPETGKLNVVKYSGRLYWQDALTSFLTARAAFTAERYEQKLADTHTRRYLAEAGLTYLITSELSGSLNYYFADYHSPGIVSDNRRVNRGILELKATF